MSGYDLPQRLRTIGDQQVVMAEPGRQLPELAGWQWLGIMLVGVVALILVCSVVGYFAISDVGHSVPIR